MTIFIQFLLRLAFGLAVGMAITSPREVTGGFFRNHLYVVLGLSTLACLVGLSANEIWWPAMVAAVLSYVASVCWLYEKASPGVIGLWLVAGFALLGTWLAPHFAANGEPVETIQTAIRFSGIVTSGLVLGVTTTSMLLGHWYLNWPGMKLAPLYRLIAIAALATILHALLSGYALVGHLGDFAGLPTVEWAMLALRWVFGIAGTLFLLLMAWQTLRIPNTQSATGILYVAVIAVFTGELAALLLSARGVLLL